MKVEELRKMDKNMKVEINGLQVVYEVSIMKRKQQQKKRKDCLMKSYYRYLDQCKNNGFSSTYIVASVSDAICIFDDITHTVCEREKVVREVQNV